MEMKLLDFPLLPASTFTRIKIAVANNFARREMVGQVLSTFAVCRVWYTNSFRGLLAICVQISSLHVVIRDSRNVLRVFGGNTPEGDNWGKTETEIERDLFNEFVEVPSVK